MQTAVVRYENKHGILWTRLNIIPAAFLISERGQAPFPTTSQLTRIYQFRLKGFEIPLPTSTLISSGSGRAACPRSLVLRPCDTIWKNLIGAKNAYRIS